MCIVFIQTFFRPIFALFWNLLPVFFRCYPFALYLVEFMFGRQYQHLFSWQSHPGAALFVQDCKHALKEVLREYLDALVTGL